MIFDVTIVTAFGCQEPCLFETANLINKYMCSDCSIGWSLSLSLPLSGPFCSLRHNSIEIRPFHNPLKAFKFSSERKSHTSLTSKQKLAMTKLSEEGMLKAMIVQKLGLMG